MNRNLILTTVTVFAISLLVLTGCKKFVHQNIKAASNSSVALLAYNDVFTQINQALSSEMALDEMTNTSWNLQGSVCATVMLEPTGLNFPKTLTVDYGAGCIGADGVLRSGKIITVFDGNFRMEGTSMLVSFEDFTTSQYAVSGTDSIYNNGVDVSDNPLFNHSINNASLTWDSQAISWEAELTRTWVAGDTTNYTTPDTTSTMGFAGLEDDVFELTGSGDGNDSNGHPYSWTTTSPLQFQTGCKYIQSGNARVTPANFNQGEIDYGTGECDKQATMEVDGEVFNFTM